MRNKLIIKNTYVKTICDIAIKYDVDGWATTFKTRAVKAELW